MVHHQFLTSTKQSLLLLGCLSIFFFSCSEEDPNLYETNQSIGTWNFIGHYTNGVLDGPLDECEPETYIIIEADNDAIMHSNTFGDGECVSILFTCQVNYINETLITLSGGELPLPQHTGEVTENGTILKLSTATNENEIHPNRFAHFLKQ